MPEVLACGRCGGELPPGAVDGPVQCSYCGATSVPAPRVIEKIVERVVLVPGATRADLPEPERTLCPRCDNPLVESHAGPHTVRGCETCGGIFLEPVAVAALERARDEAILHSLRRFMVLLRPYQTDRRGAMSCPFCKRAFARSHLGETGHSIDVCQTHGTFFDRGEVTAFVDFHQEQRAGVVTDEDLENAGVKKGWWR